MPCTFCPREVEVISPFSYFLYDFDIDNKFGNNNRQNIPHSACSLSHKCRIAKMGNICVSFSCLSSGYWSVSLTDGDWIISSSTFICLSDSVRGMFAKKTQCLQYSIQWQILYLSLIHLTQDYQNT